MTVKNFWLSVRNVFRALRNGDLLLRVKADKYYIHVMYAFLLMWISIMLSLQVDKTLTQVEENKKDLRDLEVYHAEKEAELVRLHSASTTTKRLKELGSDVALPEKPAVKLDKK